MGQHSQPHVFLVVIPAWFKRESSKPDRPQRENLMRNSYWLPAQAAPVEDERAESPVASGREGLPGAPGSLAPPLIRHLMHDETKGQ